VARSTNAAAAVLPVAAGLIGPEYKSVGAGRYQSGKARRTVAYIAVGILCGCAPVTRRLEKGAACRWALPASRG
jgi:hypothetical protein